MLDFLLDLLINIVPLVLILVLHLGLSYLARKRRSFPEVLWWLGAVVVLSCAVWYVVVGAFAAGYAECCFDVRTEPFYLSVFYRTLALPFNLCYDFPQFNTML